MFQTTVLENRHPSCNLPPTVSCQTVNMEDSAMAKLKPSGSGMTKQALVAIASCIQPATIYSRSRKWLGMTSRFESVGYSALSQSWNSHGVFALSRVARFLDFWRKSRTRSTRVVRNLDFSISSGSTSTSHRHHLSLLLVISPDKRKSLNKIVAYRCIVFLRNVAPSSATIHLFLLSTRLFRRFLRPSECVLQSIA